MPANGSSRLPEILRRHESELLDAWLREQMAVVTRQRSLLRESELRQQSAEFLHLLRDAVQAGSLEDPAGPSWSGVREMLADVSKSRSQAGFTPTETAVFLLSLKKPLFDLLRREVHDADSLARETWLATELLDRLGLWTVEVYLKSREEIIIRQQQEMMELSTPVVKLWNGILALPLIGTLDSARTQVVMEALLQRIVDTGCAMAIIDITGVPTVDTLTAQHLLKTVTAARLMGAECIISGIRPQIAQTIVHLGVELGAVTTKASLADAFSLALSRSGLTVCPARPPA